MLMDEIRLNLLDDFRMLDMLEGKTDHRALAVTFVLRANAPALKSCTRVQVGWQPELDEHGAPLTYHQALDDLPAPLAIAPDAGDNHVAKLTANVVEAATSCAMRSETHRRQHCQEVQDLFHARRGTDDPYHRKELSKKLWKALRKQRRKVQQDALQQLAQKGAGLRKVNALFSKTRGRDIITSVQDQAGNHKTDPSEIGEVFAHFYEQLYEEDRASAAVAPSLEGRPGETGHAPVTVDELRVALRRLKNGKTGAEDGLVAEMLKTGHVGLLEAMAVLF